jgi:hypothetical protein
VLLLLAQPLLKYGVQAALQAEPVAVVEAYQAILALMCRKLFVFVLEVMCVALQDFPVQTQAIYKPEAAVRAHVFAG